MPSYQQSGDDLPVSPCVGACKIDTETQACFGCARTRQEIAEFGMRYREAMQRMREGSSVAGRGGTLGMFGAKI